ncbi:hypothetical protein PHLGIDRAFT_33912 [Phlebiopsis gigantea 11061_1 CR5-6]|uniref:NADAR domain-containing protein n=1 Tax=Phlebiopsis gigantea (strain 11061_1 CR5-6) TaxID=745531 RepID=A0A0C3S409_PHLG1|nr:hypothetical protein PHLGIDRAFT_33912 [Phlebiopsis gigantea 11061_1 CR5-6]
MGFAPPPQVSGYPVIPPMPIPTQTVVIPNAMHMSQAPAMYMPIPQAMPPAPGPSATPVIPPIPQTGSGTPFPTATGPPVIPSTPAPFPQPHHHQPAHYVRPPSSDSSSEDADIPQRPATTTAQFALRNLMAQRPESIVFHHHPLPEPPKDVFEYSPYIGLLESLHRPPDDILGHHRSASLPQATGYILTPVGSQAQRPKKQRKGLFRTLSERITGKSRRTPPPEPMMVPVMFAAPPGQVQGFHGPQFDPAHFQPGVVPSTQQGPMFVPSSPGYSPAPPPPPPKTPSPAPSAHSATYSPRRQSGNFAPLRIDLAGELSGLTHLSAHQVHYGNKLFPSAMHAVEAQRFAVSKPDIVEQIRQSNSLDGVRSIVTHNSAFSRPDWDQIVLDVMEDVLYSKFLQHPDLRRLLLGTGGTPLQFIAQQDNFWGDGPLGQGANHLGKALERRTIYFIGLELASKLTGQVLNRAK